MLIQENTLEKELYYEFQDQLVVSQIELETRRLEKVEEDLNLLSNNLTLQQEYNNILTRIEDLKSQFNKNIDEIVSEEEIEIDVPLIEPQSDDVSVTGETSLDAILDDSKTINYKERISELIKEEEFATFEIPSIIKTKLYSYQIEGVYWMANLFKQGKGGILSDEMGLGKSLQAIACIAGLSTCKLIKDALIVAPGTLLNQWLLAFRKWYPYLRVIVFHNSMTNSTKVISKILNSDLATTVVITTYESIRIHKYFSRSWDMVILDEGHKIRTPNTQITQSCKAIKTPFRYILSGTPIQNSLKELWCLMDFIYPGLLGTLEIFENQFIYPINLGGYANASSVEVNTAYSCALSLKKLIDPHFKRRLKKDVAKELPQKFEYVLLCDLTSLQYNEYCKYLDSDQTAQIFAKNMNVLVGIDMLRKISNHPDLMHEISRKEANSTTNSDSLINKSGKCKILADLLNKWKDNSNNKVLLFCQTRQMLDILENMCKLLQYSYLRMDGNTPMQSRSQLVEQFNTSKSVYIFLLTTKTGGLGLNLTGANKVIIYSVDFNPSNDDQARERAWRLGQKQQVEIYRLISARSIEEKIYHRQIFKKFLANKILSDPHHKNFIKFEDMKDLFARPSAASILETRKELRKSAKPNDKATKDKVLDLLQNSTLKAFNHDRVIEGGQMDSQLAQQEAERISKNALAALKESRKTRRMELSHILEPMLKKRRFDMNQSSSILANLRVKQQREENSHIPIRNESLLLPEHKESMIVQLRDYLEHNTPTTREIITKFCTNMLESDKKIFSLMLKGVALLKTENEQKIWILKNDYE